MGVTGLLKALKEGCTESVELSSGVCGTVVADGHALMHRKAQGHPALS